MLLVVASHTDQLVEVCVIELDTVNRLVTIPPTPSAEVSSGVITEVLVCVEYGIDLRLPAMHARPGLKVLEILCVFVGKLVRILLFRSWVQAGRLGGHVVACSCDIGALAGRNVAEVDMADDRASLDHRIVDWDSGTLKLSVFGLMRAFSDDCVL